MPDGLSNMLRNMSQALKRLETTGQKRLVEMGEKLLQASQSLVPVQSGELRDSGFVNDSTPGVVEVGYSARHAIEIHEDLSRQHPTGQAKYLEQPFNELAGSFLEDLADGTSAE